MKPFISYLTLGIGLLLGWATSYAQQNRHTDVPFWQETHEAHPTSEEVRSVAIDTEGAIWIATPSGIFRKKASSQATWEKVLSDGPAYRVFVDKQSTLWLGTWNGVYRYHHQQLQRISGIFQPVSVFCSSPEGLYAIGPNGIWSYNGRTFSQQELTIPRSVRSALCDSEGNLWLASDVGLYYINKVGTTRILKSKDEVMSGYVKGIAFDNQHQLWAGGLGGVSLIVNSKKVQEITPKNSLPSVYVTCIKKAPDGRMWVGTEKGIVRYTEPSKGALLFSRRWMLHDHINDLAFDASGNAYLATAQGVSIIKRQKMTLATKNDYFQEVLIKRHIRAPWIAGQCRLEKAGDVSTWQPEDDDNDGEYTGNYLAMESFRYATTHAQDAKENAKRAFLFLKKLQEVTDTDGFFARTIVPTHWKNVQDGNRRYSPQELADDLVKEPRFKPVATRWHPSKDGQWLWKGDTSSDEMCGHFFGYFFYYQFVADDAEKNTIRTHVSRIMDYLIAHNFNFVDIDGTPTRWSIWSPDQLNRDPEWAPDRAQNSMEMLGFLLFTHYITQNPTYYQHYLHLIEKEHYLDNMAQVLHQNPAWFIYFDVVLQAYIYPILLHCEKDPTRLAFYQTHMDDWFEQRKGDQNPLINFIYCYARNRQVELTHSVNFLIDTPLDLVDWPIDHTQREDVQIVRVPVLEDEQVNILQPPSIRMTVRWDKNPWAAAGGDPYREREPIFWQLPYWMGRYLGMIQ